MPSRSDRRRRWASLSALASAALAASGSSGEAAIIYHPTPGFGAPGSLPLTGNNSIFLFRSGTPFHLVTGTIRSRLRLGFGFNTTSTHVNARGAQFRVTQGLVAVTGKGRTFNMVGTGVSNYPTIAAHRHRSDSAFGTALFFSGSGKGVKRPLNLYSSFVERVLGRRYFTTSHGRKATSVSFSAYRRSTTNNPSSYSKEYALFRFNVGPQTDYGWLELSVGFDPDSDVDILGYAYDTNGKPLPAGDVPEPKHLPLALGALALGAIGVREWRKKRNATT